MPPRRSKRKGQVGVGSDGIPVYAIEMEDILEAAAVDHESDDDAMPDPQDDLLELLISSMQAGKRMSA
eukprot:3555857-Amphidinium_carterae.1